MATKSNHPLKIETGKCSRFENSLHAQFHKKQYELVSAVPAAKLNMPAELLIEWKKNIDLEVEINKESEASVHTARLLAKDRERDKLLSNLFNVIRAQRTSPVNAISDAAETLHIAFKPYYGMQNGSFEAESLHISGLRVDAEKHPGEVATLGLMPVLAELYTVNDAFEKLRTDRRMETADSKLPNAREIRPKTDELFARICLYVLSANLHALTDDDKALLSNLITCMNQISSDFRTTFKEGQAQKKAAEKKRKEGGGKKPGDKDKKPSDDGKKPDDDKKPGGGGDTPKPGREEDPGEDKV